MMLDHLGESQAAEALVAAVAETFKAAETRIRDLAGTAKTRDVVAATVAELV